MSSQYKHGVYTLSNEQFKRQRMTHMLYIYMIGERDAISNGPYTSVYKMVNITFTVIYVTATSWGNLGFDEISCRTRETVERGSSRTRVCPARHIIRIATQGVKFFFERGSMLAEGCSGEQARLLIRDVIHLLLTMATVRR